MDPEFGPDGQPTPASLARMERGARSGNPVDMANYGLALHSRGDRAEGLSWLEKAWRAGNAGAGFNLGTVYRSQGDTNRAAVTWEQAAGLGDPDAMVGLVRLALERGAPEAATRWVDPVLRQHEVFPITALGVAFRDHGDDDTALRAFAHATGLGDPYAMEYAAEVFESRGSTELAAALRGRAASIRAAGGDEPFRH